MGRCLVGRRFEIGITEAAIAAGSNTKTLAFLCQVNDQRFIVFFKDLRADRYPQRHIGALGAGTRLAHAVLADRGLEVLLKTEIDQGVETIDDLDPDVATAAAITTIRSTELDEFFAPERYGTRAAIT